jgi:hypothetical protein
MRKNAVQQGRSTRRGEAYSTPYVEPLSEARTPLADFFRILLGHIEANQPVPMAFIVRHETLILFRHQ